jgi:hypothetical protein
MEAMLAIAATEMAVGFKRTDLEGVADPFFESHEFKGTLHWSGRSISCISRT